MIAVVKIFVFHHVGDYPPKTTSKAIPTETQADEPTLERCVSKPSQADVVKNFATQQTGSTVHPVDSFERLATYCCGQRISLNNPHRCPSGEQIAPHVLEIEKGLVTTVEELHKFKGIKENIPSVDEPKEEREVSLVTSLNFIDRLVTRLARGWSGN